MKSDTHGRPVRSNSFDLGNWAAAAGGLETIAGFDRNRRGSFKKDRRSDDFTGQNVLGEGAPTPPQLRHPPRKVSFSGQLPGLPSNAAESSPTMKKDRNTEMSGGTSSASSSPHQSPQSARSSKDSSKESSPTLPLRMENQVGVRPPT